MKHAIDRLQIQVKDDSVLAVISILHTSNITMSDSTKFSFIRSIPEAMLLNVPADNLVVNEYRKNPASGVRPMPEDLQKAREEGTKLKRGGKQKPEVGPSEAVPKPKKIKKQAYKLRSPSPFSQEPSESLTHSDVREKIMFMKNLKI